MCEDDMRKLISVVVLSLCFISVGFGQDSIDTIKYIQTLESEFNLQVNIYRKSKGLDSLPTNTELKLFCEKNNERLSRIPKFFDCVNKAEYVKMAHDSLDERIDKDYNPPRPFKYKPHYVNEIVHSRKIELTNDSNAVKKLAFMIMKGFSYSTSHYEVLVSPKCFTIYTSFKIVPIYGRLEILVTSAFTEYP